MMYFEVVGASDLLMGPEEANKHNRSIVFYPSFVRDKGKHFYARDLSRFHFPDLIDHDLAFVQGVQIGL
jgi:hypothetical protein